LPVTPLSPALSPGGEREVHASVTPLSPMLRASGVKDGPY
jgi:hypothetical protein